MDNLNLDDYIRKVPDFPKKGVLFYDITSILMSP
ncbi:MAG: adenine phosphoribosyltransferase, partial [Spirochaetaceae bacterium]|nr:adenine phosphoribosyltransferase [Spirochaetaceae bacterium]